MRQSGYNARMTRLRVASALSFALLALPLAASAQAQTQDAMRATIMAQLLQDPRSADIPPAQLQQLVDALAKQADVQQVTVSDLQWQPRASTLTGPADVGTQPESACASGFSTLCILSEGFGFAGSDPTIPLYFLVSSGLLILILARLRHHHELGHFDAAAPAAASAPSTPPTGMYV